MSERVTIRTLPTRKLDRGDELTFTAEEYRLLLARAATADVHQLDPDGCRAVAGRLREGPGKVPIPPGQANRSRALADLLQRARCGVVVVDGATRKPRPHLENPVSDPLETALIAEVARDVARGVEMLDRPRPAPAAGVAALASPAFGGATKADADAACATWCRKQSNLATAGPDPGRAAVGRTVYALDEDGGPVILSADGAGRCEVGLAEWRCLLAVAGLKPAGAYGPAEVGRLRVAADGRGDEVSVFLGSVARLTAETTLGGKA